MKYLLIILLFTACTHKGELLHEKGYVFEKQYQGEIDNSSISPGMSTSGKLVISSTHIHEDEKYFVFFKCEHGSIFPIDNKALWAELQKGDSVDISYREILYKDNTVKDYYFEGATKLMKP